MAGATIFDGLVLALERGEITEAEFYLALEEAKRQHSPDRSTRPVIREKKAKPNVLHFRVSLIRRHFFKIAVMWWVCSTDTKSMLVFVGIMALLILLNRVYHDISVKDGVLHAEDGFFVRSATHIRVANIRSVDVRQNFWQSFLGIGDIAVTSAGDRPEKVFRGIARPTYFAKVLSS